MPTRKEPEGSAQQKKAKGNVAYIRNSVGRRTGKVIIPYMQYWRDHTSFFILEFLAPQYKGIELLKKVQRTATKLVKRLLLSFSQETSDCTKGSGFKLQQGRILERISSQRVWSRIVKGSPGKWWNPHP